jgi:hypothetical protein
MRESSSLLKELWDSIDAAANDPEACSHNTKGHSFTTRFLCFLLPKSIMSKHPGIQDEMLEDFACQLQKAYHDGIEVADGITLYLAYCGQKGDMDWQALTSHSVRNFRHLGVGKPMCLKCFAGMPGYEFEDCSDNAAWIATMYAERPWEADDPEPLGIIVTFQGAPEKKYLDDLFHFLKHGLYREIGASFIVLLGRLGYFAGEPGEGNSQEAILERAWSNFSFWAKTNSKAIHMKSFSRQMLHLPHNNSFPWGGWKGSDSMKVLQWLRFILAFFISQPRSDDHLCVLRAMRTIAIASIEVFEMLYALPLWIPRDVALEVHKRFKLVIKGYQYMAHTTNAMGYNLFSNIPKLHMTHHVAVELLRNLQAGHAFIMNPLQHSTEMDEDFIGRISRLSRKVSPRLVMLRTIQRYLVALRLRLMS